MFLDRSEQIALTREVDAISIPSGDPTVLGQGLHVRVTQSLGGTYTVLTEHGVLARIEAADADAIGREAPPRPSGESGPEAFSEQLVWDQLRTCFDPEIPVNIVDLGLIY